jgi:hypothetical protein
MLSHSPPDKLGRTPMVNTLAFSHIATGRQPPTGRQLPPLSSVLYGIISRRRFVVAAQLLLREKSDA